MVPALRGRVIAIDGVKSEDLRATSSRWVISGDRNLTYSPTIPAGNDVVEGDWWAENYSGEPLVSFASEEAGDLGVKVGSIIKFNILGRPIEARVANLRQLTWGTVSFNHVIIFAPGALDDAPHTYMASMNVKDQADENRAHRTLTDAFPNVTAIRMKDVLETVNRMLSEIGAAVRGTAAIAILAGILVLAGALAAGHRHRVYDSVILKVLGAVRQEILLAYILEYMALGLITGFVALGIGTLSGYLIITSVMGMDYEFLPITMMQTVLGAVGATVFFGLLGTWKALGTKPVEVLRNP
jgi:putative ABC transport system permease protein